MLAYVYGDRQDVTGFEDYFRPERTVVLSLGMTRGHLDDPAESTCPAPRGLDIVKAVDDFHIEARQLAIPVVHVRTVLRPQKVEAKHAWTRVMPLVVGAIPNIEKNALEGSRWIEFLTQIEPGDFPVAKKGMSAFTHSDLDFLLKSLNADTVVIDGILSECCVLNTAFDASNLRYKVVVVQDLTRGYSPDTEAATLKIVSLHLGLVVDAREIASMWSRAGEPRATLLEARR